MKRFYLVASVVAVVAVGVGLLIRQGSSRARDVSSGGDSPRGVLERYQRAARANDYEEMARCEDPALLPKACRLTLLGFYCALRRRLQDKPAAEREFETLRTELGLPERAVIDARCGRRDVLEADSPAQAPLQDPVQAFVRISRWVESVLGSPPVDVGMLGGITDLVVEGARATANVGGNVVNLHAIEGRWYVFDES